MEAKGEIMQLYVPSSFTTIIVVFIILFILFWILNRIIVNADPLNIKNPLQVAIEGFYGFFENLVIDILGEKEVDNLVPIIMILFLSIFLGDISGLFLFKEVAWKSLFPVVWGITMFLWWNGYAIYRIGIKKYLGTFFKPNPAFFPLELLGTFTKVFSITLRLIGNISGGVVIVAIIWAATEEIFKASIIGGILSGIVIVPIMSMLSFYFSLFAPFIQAFVFSILTLVNISLLVSEEH